MGVMGVNLLRLLLGHWSSLLHSYHTTTPPIQVLPATRLPRGCAKVCALQEERLVGLAEARHAEPRRPGPCAVDRPAPTPHILDRHQRAASQVLKHEQLPLGRTGVRRGACADLEGGAGGRRLCTVDGEAETHVGADVDVDALGGCEKVEFRGLLFR